MEGVVLKQSEHKTASSLRTTDPPHLEAPDARLRTGAQRMTFPSNLDVDDVFIRGGTSRAWTAADIGSGRSRNLALNVYPSSSLDHGQLWIELNTIHRVIRNKGGGRGASLGDHYTTGRGSSVGDVAQSGAAHTVQYYVHASQWRRTMQVGESAIASGFGVALKVVPSECPPCREWPWAWIYPPRV